MRPAPPADGRRAPPRRARARRVSDPASAAIVAATRATRARPRPESGSRSTARVSSSSASRRSLRLALAKPRTGGEHALANGRRCLARAGRQLTGTRTRHRDDADRSGRAAPARASRGSAASRCGVQAHSSGRVAARPARAEVHRRDELEARREDHPARHPRNADVAVLERLPQRLERGALELGQLVEKEHAAVREARLAGPRHAAAAARSAPRPRPSGAARGTAGADERRFPAAGRRDRVDARHLERRVVVQRRQDPRQTPREHRLARAGRPGEEQVVPSGGSDLERPARPLLAANLGTGRGPRPATRSRRRAAAARAGRAHRAGTRRPRRDDGHRPARCRRARPRAPDSAAQTRCVSPDRRAPSAATSAPATGRSRPSRASSPTAAWPASASGGTW